MPILSCPVVPLVLKKLDLLIVDVFDCATAFYIASIVYLCQKVNGWIDYLVLTRISRIRDENIAYR